MCTAAKKQTDIDHDLFCDCMGFFMYVLICAALKTLTFAHLADHFVQNDLQNIYYRDNHSGVKE